MKSKRTFYYHVFLQGLIYGSNFSNIIEKNNISPDNIIRIKNRDIPIGLYKEEMCQYTGELSREEFKYRIRQLEFLYIDNKWIFF